MKNIDKRLIILAAILFVVMMAVRVVPTLKDQYQQGRDEISRLQGQIDRFSRLANDESLLELREEGMAQEIEELEQWLFDGNTQSLIGSSVQQQLRQAVAGADVNVREMSVAEYSARNDWLLVRQEMTFTIQQEDIIEFLDLIANSTPRLHLAEFSITFTRRQFNGSLTVIGFSRSLGQNE